MEQKKCNVAVWQSQECPLSWPLSSSSSVRPQDVLSGLYNSATAATSPPTAPSMGPAVARGAGLLLAEDAAELRALLTALETELTAPLAAEVVEVPEEAEVWVLPLLLVVEAAFALLETEEEADEVVAAAAPEEVDVQSSASGTVTPDPEQISWANWMALVWSSPPQAAIRQQLICPMKAVSEQMHFTSRPQLPMPPARNWLAQSV